MKIFVILFSIFAVICSKVIEHKSFGKLEQRQGTSGGPNGTKPDPNKQILSPAWVNEFLAPFPNATNVFKVCTLQTNVPDTIESTSQPPSEPTTTPTSTSTSKPSSDSDEADPDSSARNEILRQIVYSSRDFETTAKLFEDGTFFLPANGSNVQQSCFALVPNDSLGDNSIPNHFYENTTAWSYKVWADISNRAAVNVTKFVRCVRDPAEDVIFNLSQIVKIDELAEVVSREYFEKHCKQNYFNTTRLGGEKGVLVVYKDVNKRRQRPAYHAIN